MNSSVIINLTYWQFSFDLDVKNLDIYYKKSRASAYREIENYLYNNYFDDKNERQGSCFFTSVPLTLAQADKIINDMYIALPWLPLCVNKAALAERNPIIYDYTLLAKKIVKTTKHKKALEDYQIDNKDINFDVMEKKIQKSIMKK